MTDDERVLRAEHAQTLIDNPLLKKSIQAIKNEIIMKWENSPPETPDNREYLWHLQQAVIAFENVLFGYIQTGKIAREQLQQKNLKQRV